MVSPRGLKMMPVSGSGPVNGGAEPTSIALVFSTLIAELVAAQKGCMPCVMATTRSCLEARWRVVSSACWCVGGAGEPSGRRMGEMRWDRCRGRKWEASGWEQILYKRGERGLP